jgi:YD repeat-containing protein
MNGFVLVYDAWNRLAAVRDDADFVQKWRYDGWNPGS